MAVISSCVLSVSFLGLSTGCRKYCRSCCCCFRFKVLLGSCPLCGLSFVRCADFRGWEMPHAAPHGASRVTESSPVIADYQLALDAMRDGVALWSADGRLMVANTAASTLMSPSFKRFPGIQAVAT